MCGILSRVLESNTPKKRFRPKAEGGEGVTEFYLFKPPRLSFKRCASEYAIYNRLDEWGYGHEA